MDKWDRKRSFKTKVIAKLFGQADEDDYIQAVSSDFDEGDDIDTLENSVKSPHTKVYGAECCPTGQKQENSDKTNGHECDLASSVSTSDDEDSECFEVRKKRKRRGRLHHPQEKQQCQPSSSNSSSQTNENACSTNNPSPLTVPCLSKNKKRKLKKKQKKREKKTQNSSCMEFTFNSSGQAFS